MALESAARPDDAGMFATPAPFGPSFFLGPLKAFARECCPSAAEGLPSVTVYLATGETLELCHVAGLGPGFAALAVLDEAAGAAGARPMRTELVPYSLIARITLRARRGSHGHVGFDAGREPELLASGSSPVEMLRSVANAPPQADGPSTGDSGNDSDRVPTGR